MQAKALIASFLVAAMIDATVQVVMAGPLTPPSFAVDSGSYRSWLFEVSRSARIYGRFHVQDKGELSVLLIDENEFENFRNGREVRTYYSSGMTNEGAIDTRLYAGRYVIIFDNQFSRYSNKTVHSNLQIDVE